MHAHKYVNRSHTMCKNGLLIVNIAENGGLAAFPKKRF